MKSVILSFILLFSWIFLQAQETFVLESDYLTRADTVWVFTPADYDISPEEKFPVVYLLHGWNGYYQHWDEIMDCQAYADTYGFIIVCPDGLYDSWYLNSPVKTENQYEDFFLRELMPLIAYKFRIQKDNVFITGLSMGGHGALYIFARNPSLFRSAGSLSGLLELEGWREYYGISRILGLHGTDNNDTILGKFSVTGNLDGLVKANKEIIVSCGTEDPFYVINIHFMEACGKKEIEVLFIASKGGHNSDYWRSAIDEHFQFFTRRHANGVPTK